MSKNLRIIIPAILVFLALLGFWWQRDKYKLPVSGDAGAVVAVDGGMAVAADAGVVALDVDTGVVVAAADAGPTDAVAGDASGTDEIPACGNCSFNPVTGALSIQLQKRLTGEPTLNWNVIGVEVLYNGAAPQLRNVVSGSTLITGADANCGNTRTFTLQTATPTNIRAINLRLSGGAPLTSFKRNCVKLASGGGVTILESNCKCCACGLCTDVGTCP